MASEQHQTNFDSKLSAQNALQSDFEETESMNSDERYLVRSHATIRPHRQP